MAKDRRLYAQLTLDFADSHKIAPLSDAAFRAYIRMLLWSRRMLTDGKIPGAMALVFAKPKVLVELTANDPENPSLIKSGDDYWIHDFAEHQTTTAQIDEKAKTNAENGKKGGRPPKRNPTETESVSIGLANGNRTETQSTEYREHSTSNEVEVPRDDVIGLCSLLADLIESNGSLRPTIGKGWLDAARLLLDKDGRDYAAAERLIRWVQADEFWKGNVLSMSTFRTKYDQLRLAANAGLDKRRGGSQPIAKADQNAAEFKRIYGGGNERAGSVPAIDAGIGA